GKAPPNPSPIATAPVKTPSTTGSSPPPNEEGRANGRAMVPSTRSVTLAIATVTASPANSPRSAYVSAGAARYARANDTWLASPGMKAPTKATMTSPTITHHGTPVATAQAKPNP